MRSLAPQQPGGKTVLDGETQDHGGGGGGYGGGGDGGGDGCIGDDGGGDGGGDGCCVGCTMVT